MPPVRAGNIGPPVVMISEIDAPLRFLKNYRRRFEHLGQSSRIVFRLWRTLGDSDMVRCFNKACELLVGYRVSVDPEALNGRGVHRRLFGIMAVRSHLESAAGNPGHVSVRSRLISCR